MSNKIKLLKDEILYRSIHRGCKETDFLIGKYAENEMDNLEEDDLLILKDLIGEDDMMIYDWILQKIDYPEKYSNLLAKMRDFHNLS